MINPLTNISLNLTKHFLSLNDIHWALTDLIQTNDYEELDCFQQSFQAIPDHKLSTNDGKLDEKSLIGGGFESIFGSKAELGNFITPSSTDTTFRLGSVRIGSSKNSLIVGKNFLSHRLRLEALERRSPIDECSGSRGTGGGLLKDEAVSLESMSTIDQDISALSRDSTIELGGQPNMKGE